MATGSDCSFIDTVRSKKETWSFYALQVELRAQCQGCGELDFDWQYVTARQRFCELMQCIDHPRTAGGSHGGHQLNVMLPVRPVMRPLHRFILLCSARLKISPNTSESLSLRLRDHMIVCTTFWNWNAKEPSESLPLLQAEGSKREGRAYKADPAAPKESGECLCGGGDRERERENELENKKGDGN